jgi:hypothetical protein
MPFDGCFYEYLSMVDCVRTDFKNYLYNLKEYHNSPQGDPPHYRRHDSASDEVLGYWNHESKFDLNQLIERSKQRTEQFIEVLSRPNEPVLFLYYKDSCSHNINTSILTEALAERYPQLKYHIFVVSFCEVEKFTQQENYSEYGVVSMHPRGYGEAAKPYNDKILIKLCNILEEDPAQYLGIASGRYIVQE